MSTIADRMNDGANDPKAVVLHKVGKKLPKKLRWPKKPKNAKGEGKDG